jgi:RNA polymerase primary sigma factor
MRQLKLIKQITNREAESLDKYLQEIGKVDLLSVEAEVELARRIREGDPVALQKLTKANLRFVVSVAKQYQNYGMTLGDLINEGNLGLIKAAQRFDETRGFKFISYAVWWIRQAIMQSLAEQSRIVRLPLNRVSSLNRIAKAFSSLEQKYQREPSETEVAEAVGLSPADITDHASLAGRHVSVDAPRATGEEDCLLDVLTDESQESPDARLIANSLKEEIQRALATLPSREAEVLSLYYGLDNNMPLTLEELGDKFGLTRERVRQIKEKATCRLRTPGRTKVLKTFL